MSKLVKMKDGTSYLVPFLLITSLFFLWGFAHSILDVLNKYFQDAMEITKTRSALIQVMVYGGYFLMAIPAGKIIRKYGYRTGVIIGLLLYGFGALLFIPGSRLMSFEFFLFSLFIVGCGLTCLETAANPYVTVLGEPDAAERRINLAQSFNGFGWICGPLVGGFFLFANEDEVNIAAPYAIIGVVVLLVALLFSRVKLPEVGVVSEAEKSSSSEKLQVSSERMKHVASEAKKQADRSLWKISTFTVGLVALFLYVAAQTGINSFFINYMTENAGVSAHEASLWLSFGGMGLFMAGRMGGSWLMTYLHPEDVLALCGIGALLAMLGVIFLSGEYGRYCFFLCFACESIMFPTIFALAIRETSALTKQASSYLIMSIVGGAVAPVLMGLIGDHLSMQVAFVIPLVCFIVIGGYAISFRKLLAKK